MNPTQKQFSISSLPALARVMLTLAVATSLPEQSWAQASANGRLRDSTGGQGGGDVNAVSSGTASSQAAIIDFSGDRCQMHAGGFAYLGVVGAGAHVSSQGGFGSAGFSAGAGGSWTDGLNVVWPERFSVSNLGHLRLHFNVGAHGSVSATSIPNMPPFATGSAEIGYTFNFGTSSFAGTQTFTGGETLIEKGTWGTIAGSVDLPPSGGSGNNYVFSGVSLTLSGSAGALVQSSSSSPGPAVTADADFGSTLQWKGVVEVQAFDSAGIEITLPAGFQVGLVGSETGFDYWNEAPLAVVAEAPTLTIVPATPGNFMISWTPNTPGFGLQETLSLSPTNWVNSASGPTNPIVVPAALPAKFYRLFKP